MLGQHAKLHQAVDGQLLIASSPFQQYDETIGQGRKLDILADRRG